MQPLNSRLRFLILTWYAIAQAEQWVNNMSKAADDERIEVEGRPSRSV